MNKEIGKIENNKVTFLQLAFEIDVQTGVMDANMLFDKRLIKKENTKKMKRLINDFAQELYESIKSVLEENQNG